MTEATKPDLVHIRAGNIDTITAQLADLSEFDLNLLRRLEQESEKPRKGVIEAIEAVGAARSEQAAKDLAGVTRSAVSAATAAIAVELKELKQALAVSEQNRAKLVKQLAAAKKKTGAKDAAKVVEVEPHEIFISLSAEPRVTVVFSDRDNIVDGSIPALTFDDSDFIRARHGDVLARDIEFDGQGPASEIAAAWLVDADGNASGVSRFAVPLMVGGGRKALLGKRSLKFIDDRPAAAVEAEEEADEADDAGDRSS